jgi:hypothetical protein
MATCKLTKAQQHRLETLVEAYEMARGELSSFLADVQSDWQGDMDDKSEKWTEGEAGQEAQERLDTLTAWLDEMPGECVVDPEQVG